MTRYLTSSARSRIYLTSSREFVLLELLPGPIHAGCYIHRHSVSLDNFGRKSIAIFRPTCFRAQFTDVACLSQCNVNVMPFSVEHFACPGPYVAPSVSGVPDAGNASTSTEAKHVESYS